MLPSSWKGLFMKYLLSLLAIGCLGLSVVGCQSEAKTVVPPPQPAETSAQPEKAVCPEKAAEAANAPDTVIAPKIPTYFGEPDDFNPLTEEGCGQAE